jgi:hypothetical protein
MGRHVEKSALDPINLKLDTTSREASTLLLGHQIPCLKYLNFLITKMPDPDHYPSLLVLNQMQK